MITPEQIAASGSEHSHQAAIFCWANQNLQKYPDLKWLFAIPNGGARDKRTGAKLKAEGVKPGVPDMFLMAKRGRYAGLWIELKKPAKDGKKAGVVSGNQLPWLEQARVCGHGAIVCYGWEDAVKTLITYLEFK